MWDIYVKLLIGVVEIPNEQRGQRINTIKRNVNSKRQSSIIKYAKKVKLGLPDLTSFSIL